MLFKLLQADGVASAQEAIVKPQCSVSWPSFREQAEDFRKVYRVLAKRRVGLVFFGEAECYAMAAALDELQADVFLMDSRLSVDGSLSLARDFRLGALLLRSQDAAPPDFDVHELQDEERGSARSSVTVLTSGSTGRPKAATHSWESLSRPIRKGTYPAPRWLLTYRPNLYAGLQVMLQCFGERGTLVILDPGAETRAAAEFMRAAAVQFISATPSFWRRLLMFADPQVLKSLALIQITLGGEVVDQTLLDKIQHYFPQVRLVHIYATTELGRCFSVSDGLAGFPARYLDQQLPDGVEMKVQDGELLVRSPNRMLKYDAYSAHHPPAGGWFSTGDLVEIKGGRVYFVGRKTDMINVAGSKVYPLEVEQIIRVVPGVSDVRVYGKASSIAGELVACDIVPNHNENPDALRDRITKVCRTSLSTYQQPRVIKFVEQIELSSAGKTIRNRVS